MSKRKDEEMDTWTMIDIVHCVTVLPKTHYLDNVLWALDSFGSSSGINLVFL